MRIACLAPCLPGDPDASRRLDAMLEGLLAAGHTVRLAMIGPARPGAARLAALAERVGLPAYLAGDPAAPTAGLRQAVRDFLQGAGAEQVRLADPALATLLDAPQLAASAIPMRRRLLLVTDIPFWEGWLGNQARLAALLQQAREHFAITVFTPRRIGTPERDIAAAMLGDGGALVGAADLGPATESLPGPLLTPYERQTHQGATFAALEAHLAAHRYDVAVIAYLRLAYLRHAQGMPALTALDTHDVIGERAATFARFGERHDGPDAFAELETLAGFPLIIAIQAWEQRHLEALFPGRVLLLPYAQPVAPPRPPASGIARRIVFIGGPSPMNRDGLQWFLDQVWPCFARGGAELHVIGAVSETIRTTLPAVVTHGPVHDARRLLADADIAVNPVFYGGGLKIKSVEALCLGLPSVLSEEAAFGLPAPGPGDLPFLCAASRADFIASLDRLIHEPSLRDRVSAAARLYAARHFDPGAVSRQLVALGTLAA